MDASPSLNLKPLDVLACSGRSRISRGIRCITCSPWSHVAIVARVEAGVLGDDEFSELLVFESTTMSSQRCAITRKLMSGVQAHYINSWIFKYPGKVYVLRYQSGCSEERQEEESKRLTGRLLSLVYHACDNQRGECDHKDGTPYDSLGAFFAGTRILKWCPCLADRIDNRQAQFCVEVNEVALQTALQHSVGPVLDPGRHRPKDHVKALVKSRCWNKPERIK